MLTTHRTVGFPTALRTAALAGLLIAAPLALTACSSGSTAAPAASSTTASSSAPVVVSTSEAVVTTTDVVTDTTKITELTGVTRSLTAQVTPTTTAGPAGGGGKTTAGPTTMSGGGGDDHSGSTPNPCPDPATLGAVTPNYDPQYPINAINCAGEWAVGTYEADGKNQTTGIWRNTGGGWAYQDRAAICATADNLPDDLYAQACEGN